MGRMGTLRPVAEGPERVIRAIGHTFLEPDAARIPGYIIEADEPLYSIAARPEEMMHLSAYGPEGRLLRVTDLEDVTCYWTAPSPATETEIPPYRSPSRPDGRDELPGSHGYGPNGPWQSQSRRSRLIRRPDCGLPTIGVGYSAIAGLRHRNARSLGWLLG
jgi:hypothetical protein